MTADKRTRSKQQPRFLDGNRVAYCTNVEFAKINEKKLTHECAQGEASGNLPGATTHSLSPALSGAEQTTEACLRG